MRTHLALAFVLAACGGGSGGGLGTGPIEQAEAEELCRADCQRDIDCGEEFDLESCTARCADDVVGWARADAVQTIFECTAALACGQTDDGCQRDLPHRADLTRVNSCQLSAISSRGCQRGRAEALRYRFHSFGNGALQSCHGGRLKPCATDPIHSFAGSQLTAVEGAQSLRPEP